MIPTVVVGAPRIRLIHGELVPTEIKSGFIDGAVHQGRTRLRDRERLERKHVLVVLVHQVHAQRRGYVAGGQHSIPIWLKFLTDRKSSSKSPVAEAHDVRFSRIME